MRKTRRRISLLSSVLAAMASTAGGTYLVLSMNLDSVGATTLGLDPLIVMGLSVIGTGCVGWLLGPALGDAVFRLANRKIGAQIAQVGFLFLLCCFEHNDVFRRLMFGLASTLLFSGTLSFCFLRPAYPTHSNKTSR